MRPQAHKNLDFVLEMWQRCSGRGGLVPGREERGIRKRKLGLPVIHRARECAPEVRRTGIRVLDDLLEKRTRPGGTPRRQPHPPPTTKNLPLPPSPTPYPYQNNRGRLTIVSRPPNVAPRGLEPRFKV